MNPTVGRIVHFIEREYGVGGKETSHVVPAIIAEVHSPTLVDLRLLGRSNTYLTNVTQGDGEPGKWIWPPRA